MIRFIICVSVVLSTIFANAGSKKTPTIVLTKDNTVVLNEEINRSSVGKLMRQLNKLDSKLKSTYPIYLFLYTPGGSLRDGLELIEAIRGLNRPVHTITLFAASMGFQIVQNLGNRYIMKFGVLMSHKARGIFKGEFGGGISQLDSRIGLWSRMMDLLDKQTVLRTKGKQTLKSYRAAYTPELWLHGIEAVKQGYAYKVVKVKCGASLQGNHKTIIDKRLFKVEVTLSNCPSNQNPISLKALIYTNKGLMSLQKYLASGGIVDKYCDSDMASYDNEDIAKKQPLCITTKSITVDKILKNVDQIRNKYNRGLRDSVVYSY